jgi:hypothetical protein
MISLAVYCFVVFGIAWGLGHAHLSFPVRKRLQVAGFDWLVTLLECVGCSSWHLGWIAYAAGLAPAPLTSWWVAAFATATSSLILGRLTGMDHSEQ